MLELHLLDVERARGRAARAEIPEVLVLEASLLRRGLTATEIKRSFKLKHRPASDLLRQGRLALARLGYAGRKTTILSLTEVDPCA